MPHHLQVHVVTAAALDHELELVDGATGLHEVLHRDGYGFVAVRKLFDTPEGRRLLERQRQDRP